jgi:hypothetical protein
MIIGSGITVGSGVRFISETTIYTAGLYKTTYAGYFSNVPSFFATATPTTYGSNPATSVQTTAITEAASNDGSNFSCQWLGYFLPSTTETYTFLQQVMMLLMCGWVQMHYLVLQLEMQQ